MEPSPIAIFIPTRNEARGIFKHFQIYSKISDGSTQIYHAQTKPRKNNTLLILSGMGPQLAKQAVEKLLEIHAPKEIWLLGVCGATQIGYETGDAFIAQEIISEKTALSFKTAPHLQDRASRAFEKTTQRFHSGKILTMDRMVENSSEKISLGKIHDCLALEMEAYPIAQAAQQKNIPFIEIRWVLDPAEYNVPHVQAFVNSSGEVRPMVALKSFAQNPTLTFQMIPFVQKVQSALKNMNEFLHSYLEDGRI